MQAPRGEILDRNGQGPGRQPHRARAAGQADRAAREQGPPRAAVQARRRGRRHAPEADPQARSASRPRTCPASPVTLRARRLLRPVYYLRENQARFPGRHASSGSTCATTRTGRSPRRSSATSRGRRPSSSRSRATRALEPGDQVGQSGRRVHLRQPPARHQRHDPGPGRRRRAARPAAGSPSASRRAGRRPACCRIDDAVQEAGEAALSDRSACRAPSWR